MIARKTCTLIGSDKGGVGKSLMAQIFVAAYDQGGRPLKVIEIDNQRTLTSVFKDRVDLSLDASPALDSEDGRGAMHRHFARPYALWAESDSVTDLGANVTSPILNWMQQHDIPSMAQEDGIGFRFLSIAIPDDQSLRSAVSSIEMARRGLGIDARIHLILNDTVGLSGFAPYEDSEIWQRLMAMQASHKVDVLHIPHCSSRIMDWGRARGLTVLQILENGDQVSAICEAAGFTRAERQIEIRSFIAWIKAVQSTLSPLFAQARSGYVVAAE